MQRSIFELLATGQPLPDEVRNHLLFAFENLCAGARDEILIPVRSKKGGAPGKPIKQHLQTNAIRYLRWVEAGRITDPNAVKMVAAAYDVTEKTVANWVSDWSERPTPDLHEDFGEDTVRRLMIIAGSRYKQW
jgi:hypothetical protein